MPATAPVAVYHRAVEGAGDAEVREARLVTVFEQDVRGLDVAVHEAVRVDVRERVGQPDGQHAYLRRR